MIGAGPQIGPNEYAALSTFKRAWEDWRQCLIDRLAKDARIMTGHPDDSFGVVYDDNRDTHSALILDVQPLNRGVSKQEIINVLRHCPYQIRGLEEMANRIERFGIQNE